MPVTKWVRLHLALVRALCCVVALAVPLAAPGGALAAAPWCDIWGCGTYSVDTHETYLDGEATFFCGFDVIRTEDSHIRFTLTASKDGSKVQMVVAGPTLDVYFAPSTGLSVSVRNTGGGRFANEFRTTEDGSSFRFLALFHGLNYQIKTNEGTFVSAGSTTDGQLMMFSSEGDPTAVQVLGHSFTPSLLHVYPRLCVYLGATDTDRDFLPDTTGVRTELAFGTDPLNPDTDGDGHSDGDEVGNETDPLNPASYPRDGAIGDQDKDDDFVADGLELYVYGTDPFNPDTDGDSFLDGEEIHLLGTDPLDPFA